MADQPVKGPGRTAFEEAIRANRIAKEGLWKQLRGRSMPSLLTCEKCGRREKIGVVAIVHERCEETLWPGVPCNLHARLCVNCLERLKRNKLNIFCRLHKR